ncbi:MAG: hypothetical protein ACR2M8_01090 [Pyrinomonadaceae bacterium]|nr:hypothetical protein [Blastocatellia bacterium]MDQ3489917.1 hypothetical protein [Acidobacteriota bacterium]
MIDEPAIREILALYKNHGWKLRRVLLSSALEKSFSAASSEIFDDVEITQSTLDAAWFSRSARLKSETWELRLLDKSPFALIAVIDDNIDDHEIREILQNTELKMMQTTKKGMSSH